MDHQWIRLTRQRVNILRLIWRGVSRVDEIMERLFLRRNVVVNQIRALETAGLITRCGGALKVVKNPKNLALLLSHGVITPAEYITELLRYLEEASGGSLRFLASSEGLTLLANGMEGLSALNEIREELRELGFRTVRVSYSSR